MVKEKQTVAVELKWGDAIPKLGIAKLIPEPGCLVDFCGEWCLIYEGQPTGGGDWDGNNITPHCVGSMIEVNEFNVPNGHKVDLVLPRVPEDKTCWDVLKLWPGAVYTGDEFIVIKLENGQVSLFADGKHVYDGCGYLGFVKLVAAARDIAKCQTIGEWITANEVA